MEQTSQEFKPKIDYDDSLISIACSIMKYFELNPLHKSHPYLDELFSEKQPENIILLLCDGFGSRVIDKVLNKDDFLIKNRKKEIFSVFPPTTSANLSAIKLGLNPSEHGWIGWSCYIPPINKIINLYKDTEKGKTNKDEDFEKIKDKYFYNKKTIVEMINEKGKYNAYELNCYPYNVERNIDKVFEKILDTLKVKTNSKKYIFSYYPEPDDILHALGIESQEAIDEIKKINLKVEKYSELILKHEKTMLIIVADHGHLIGDKIKIQNYEMYNYLREKKVYIENRSPNFLVKKGFETNFIQAFNKDFGNDFFLLSKKEILEKKIFGEYALNNEHELFEDSLGDFMAISKGNSNKVLLSDTDPDKNTSYHGGYHDDEIYIPLIIINN